MEGRVKPPQKEHHLWGCKYTKACLTLQPQSQVCEVIVLTIVEDTVSDGDFWLFLRDTSST
jgi:hypothetical protein